MPHSILDRLRQETAPMHRELEDAVDIASRIRSRREYQRLLEQFLGFYAPMEDRMAACRDWAAEGIDFERRRKAPWLRKDLSAMGLRPDEIDALPVCEDLPSMPDGDTAAGCFYVIEGSTLGGRHISAMLADSESPGTARRFFQGYGDHTGTKWKQTCATLEEMARKGQADRIISGAAETFRSLQRWMAHQGSLA